MARVKNTPEIKENEAAEVENTAEVAENETKMNAIEDIERIPKFIQGVLESFANLEYAYVNEKGGLFTVQTPESMRGDAVLYKNPYFKN